MMTSSQLFRAYQMPQVNRNTVKMGKRPKRADTHQEVAERHIISWNSEAYMSESKINPVSGIFLGKAWHERHDKTGSHIRFQW